MPEPAIASSLPSSLPAKVTPAQTPRRRTAIVAIIALLLLGGIAAGAVLVLRGGGKGDGRAIAKAADCQAGDLPWGQTLALLNDGSAPAGPYSPATGQIAEWSRQLRRSDSGAFVECSVSTYASASAAQAAYTEVTNEIEHNDFLTTLLASPMSKLAAPGIGDASAAYEGHSASGSDRHAIIVVFTKGTGLGIVRFREGTTTLLAKDALVVARAMGGRLTQSSMGSIAAPPASGVEAPSATLGQISPQDAVTATGALASQVADLGDAEAALIQALQSGTATADEVAQLQTTLASRGLAVGRSADLLADTTGQSSAAPAAAAAAMYRDIATVAYTQALSVADASASDLLGPSRTQAIQAIALLSTTLSAGTPAHRAIFAAALGPSYQNNVIAVPVASTAAGVGADTVVTASQARRTFTVDMSLVTPDGTTAAALNAAADPAGGASLQQMRDVAAARLLLHAEQKRASSTAPLSAWAQPLTFDMAKQIVMSKGVLGADSDATMTFFALADRNDVMQMFSFFNKKAPGGIVESPNQMVWLAALKTVTGSGGDAAYVALLSDAIRGGVKPANLDRASADSLQRLIFDQYLAIKEPTINVTGARFVDPNVQIDVSYQIHQGAITVTCAVSGVEDTLYLNGRTGGAQSTPDGYTGTETVNLRVDRTTAHSWSYSCWSLYGQVGAGEVNDGGAPAATAAASATPEPSRPTATRAPAEPPPPPPSAPPPAPPRTRPADCPTPDADGVTHTDLEELLRCS